jgi:hypothetical protein
MAYDGTFGQIFHRMIIALYAIYSRMAMVNTWPGSHDRGHGCNAKRAPLSRRPPEVLAER